MSKIITVTLNSAIDMRISLPDLHWGDTYQATHSSEWAAGKGINMAKTLAALDCPVTAFAFVGEQSLSFFNTCQRPYLTPHYLAVAGKTRSNITLFNHTSKQETHIRTTGFSVSATDCQHFLQQLAACVTAGDSVILAGSLPRGAPSDFYAQLITQCQQQRATCFLDSSGDSLKQGLLARPFLLKPNRQEFEHLLGRPLKNTADVVSAARELIAAGITWVIVSCAEHGAIFVNQTQAFSACITIPAEPAIVSYVGCGDALLAGFVLAMAQKSDTTDCIKLALACGTANLFAAEPGNISLDWVKRFQEKVVITAL